MRRVRIAARGRSARAGVPREPRVPRRRLGVILGRLREQNRFGDTRDGVRPVSREDPPVGDARRRGRAFVPSAMRWMERRGAMDGLWSIALDASSRREESRRSYQRCSERLRRLVRADAPLLRRAPAASVAPGPPGRRVVLEEPMEWESLPDDGVLDSVRVVPQRDGRRGREFLVALLDEGTPLSQLGIGEMGRRQGMPLSLQPAQHRDPPGVAVGMQGSGHSAPGGLQRRSKKSKAMSDATRMRKIANTRESSRLSIRLAVLTPMGDVTSTAGIITATARRST